MLDPSHVANLIDTLGQTVLWEHAIAASGSSINPITRQPRMSATDRMAVGPTGERYHEAYRVKGFFSRKVSALMAQAAMLGIVDQIDASLCLPAVFAPDPSSGIVMLPPELRAAYNGGHFAYLDRGEEEDRLIARDAFTISGLWYIVKMRPTPITVHDSTIAWRLLLVASNVTPGYRPERLPPNRESL